MEPAKGRNTGVVWGVCALKREEEASREENNEALHS